MKKLLLVGLYAEVSQWEFCGIYDNKDAALNRCTQDNNFIWLVGLNESMPESTTEQESFYPKLNDEPVWFTDYK